MESLSPQLKLVPTIKGVDAEQLQMTAHVQSVSVSSFLGVLLLTVQAKKRYSSSQRFSHVQQPPGQLALFA